MALADDLDRIARAASARLHDREEVAAVLAAEADPGSRVYLVAVQSGEQRTWLALDDAGNPVRDRRAVRDAATMGALCEVAADSAGGGDLDELLAHLVALRVSEAPPGIEEAEEAVRSLQRTIGAPPHLASPARLDEIGVAARRLELALDPAASSPFAAAMRSAQGAVEELAAAVESAHREPLQ